MSSSARNVFLAPCDSEEMAEPLRSPVDTGALEEAPASLPEGESVRLWGVPPGEQSRANFEKMAAGDVLLFYDGETFVGTGLVGVPLEDEGGWRASVWDGDPPTLVSTVEDFRRVSVPRAAVNRLFEYSESWTPGGLLRVADSRVENTPEAIKLAIERYDDRS